MSALRANGVWLAVMASTLAPRARAKSADYQLFKTHALAHLLDGKLAVIVRRAHRIAPTGLPMATAACSIWQSGRATIQQVACSCRCSSVDKSFEAAETLLN